ncbi:MAG: hypothetical protein CBC65_002050 [Rhodothermaceae bacterium TMED105]|nr:MAG: hypothetical protein CBC65_002050 [Rhodothermaceae bacterium TMED105]
MLPFKRSVEIRSTFTFQNDILGPVVGQERRIRRDERLTIYHLEKRLVHEMEVEEGGEVEMRALDDEWSPLAEFDSLYAALLCVSPMGENHFSVYCDGNWLATFQEITTTLEVVSCIV